MLDEIKNYNYIEESFTKWDEMYLSDYRLFIQEIFDWNPDYIIPVARKSCKLLSSISKELNPEINKRIFYLEHFEFDETDLSNKKIAVVDDVTKTSITLAEYRAELIELGCKNENIRTYAFIGHENLIHSKNKFDKEIIIFQNRLLPNRDYQQYISIQSNHLLLTNFHSDIDHLVIQTEIEGFSDSNLASLKETLNSLGYYYELNEIEGIKRFGVHFDKIPDVAFIGDKLGLDIGNEYVFKVKFVYEESTQRLTYIPLFFPRVNIGNTKFIEKLKAAENPFPFKLPISYRRSINYETLYSEKHFYWNICLFFSVLGARYFYLQLRKTNYSLIEKFKSFTIRTNDLSRYLGKEIAEEIIPNIKSYILLERNDFDIAFDDMEFNESLFPDDYNESPDVRAILKHLREGYTNNLNKYIKEKTENPLSPAKKSQFEATVQELLSLGTKTHPLQFTILVDELCDFGMIVPKTKYSEQNGCWRRAYRSGENHPDEISWDRTRAILAICLDELGEKQTRIFLEKVLANFTHDFPPFFDRKIKGTTDNHCIYTIPYLFGPVNQTMHFQLFEDVKTPYQFFNPNHIENKQNKRGESFFSDEDHLKYKSIAELIKYEPSSIHEDENNEGDIFIDNDYHKLVFSLNLERYDFLKIDEFVDSNSFYNYFGFLKKIYEKTGTVKNILALAIGRNTNVFKHYISFNINNSLYNIYKFTQDLSNSKSTNYLSMYHNYLGSHISSIKQKIDAAKEINKAWATAQSIVSTNDISNKERIGYNKAWKYILGNNSYEDILNISSEVIKYTSNYEGLVEVLSFLNHVIKYKCDQNQKSLKILQGLSENVKNNALCSLKLEDFFDSDSNGELTEIKKNDILISNINTARNRIYSSISDYLVPYSKEHATNQKISYYLQKFYLNKEVYKKKKEFAIALEMVLEEIKMFGDGYHYEPDSYKFNEETDGKRYFFFKNNFGDRILAAVSKNLSLERIEKIN